MICFSIFIDGCKKNSNIQVNNSGLIMDDDYSRYLKTFDSSIVSQFPKNIESKNNFVVCNTNSEKNDLGLFLIEYDLSDLRLKSIEKQAIEKSLKIYNTSDTCKLVVNRFETEKTKREFIIAEVLDSSSIDKPCYKDLLPIPNFIEYSISSKTNFWDNHDFLIYVLDAKFGNYSREFNLEPNLQMPNYWSNGYSKGIAINNRNKTVIYWSIIW